MELIVMVLQLELEFDSVNFFCDRFRISIEFENKDMYVHLYIQNWNISTQFALELHANIKFNISILASNFDLNFEFLV